MKNRDERRLARLVQDVTGARYSSCLRKLRSFTTPEVRECYLDGVEAVPENRFGTPSAQLCLDCLAPWSAFHRCPEVSIRVEKVP